MRLKPPDLSSDIGGSRLRTAQMTPDVGNRCPNPTGGNVAIELQDRFVVTVFAVMTVMRDRRSSHG